MATVSSHILDSVHGGSAVGIRVELLRIVSNTERQPVFDVIADSEGRISEAVRINADSEYELLFYGTDYFSDKSLPEKNEPMISTVVIRFSMSDDEKRYHIPLMLSPHAYSVWWS